MANILMTGTVYGDGDVVSFDHLRDIFHDRTGTIRWFYLIKNICESKHCLDIFDLGVHIFDGFLSRYFSTGERNEHKTKEFFGLYGAASMILSSKLHDQKSDLSFASFPYYSEEHLSDAERVILTTIDYKIDSLNNPLFLARKMYHVKPPPKKQKAIFLRIKTNFPEFRGFRPSVQQILGRSS